MVLSRCAATSVRKGFTCGETIHGYCSTTHTHTQHTYSCWCVTVMKIYNTKFKDHSLHNLERSVPSLLLEMEEKNTGSSVSIVEDTIT